METVREHKIYELLHSHRSVRSYKKEKVPEPILDRILRAATRASSSGNMQTYSIIATEDQDLKQKLFEPHFQQSMVLEAPLLLTFCADFHRMRRWLKLSQAPDNFDNFVSFMIAAIDAILASQNAAIAAEAEGLGVCYMGTTLASCGEIAKILKCPDNVVPVVGFVLGYPDESIEPRDRLPLHGLVHRETYHNYTDDEILEIYKQREEAGFKRYMNIPELREKVIEAGAENLAQIYTKAKYTKESHLGYSKDILDCLRQQNFFNHDFDAPSKQI